MPPQRTVPPTRPLKTERTHEENQERAYIAASRRSDRSLEARVESARRASEIHKRRTGRSLRVTEQDVINEEMYEEEDDDMPMRLRGMTSHLQTDNNEFNRRLSAYIANQVAMRDTHQLFAAQFPNVPQYPQNQAALFQSNMLAQQYQQQILMQQQQQQLNNSSMNQTNSYVQTPYLASNTQHQSGFRPSIIHNRSASIATPQSSTASLKSPAIKSESPRRMSTTDASRSDTPSLEPIRSLPAYVQPAQSASPFQQFLHGPFVNNNNNSHVSTPNFAPFSNFGMDNGFLTTELPNETQQLLADPTTIGSMYSWQSNPLVSNTSSMEIGKNGVFPANFGRAPSTGDGLNSTLAPSDTSPGDDYNSYGGTAGGMSFFDDGLRESGYGSGNGTPGQSGFDLFIDQDTWADPPGSQESTR